MITSEHATHTHEHSKNLRVKEPRAAPGAGGGSGNETDHRPRSLARTAREMCQEDQGQHPGVCEDWNSQNTRQGTAECLFRGLSHASAQDTPQRPPQRHVPRQPEEVAPWRTSNTTSEGTSTGERTAQRRLFVGVCGLWLHQNMETQGPGRESSASPPGLPSSASLGTCTTTCPKPCRSVSPTPGSSLAAPPPPLLLLPRGPPRPCSSRLGAPPHLPASRLGACPAPAPHTWGPTPPLPSRLGAPAGPPLGQGHPCPTFLGANNRPAHEAQPGVDLWPPKAQWGPLSFRDSLLALLKAANHTDTFWHVCIKKAKFSNNKDKHWRFKTGQNRGLTRWPTLHLKRLGQQPDPDRSKTSESNRR